MPVNIGQPEDMTEEEFAALKRAKNRSNANPLIEEVLDRVESGRPQRVPLPEGQNAKGARIAIARAAGRRGLSVETVEGDGFIGVTRVEVTPPRRAKAAPVEEGQRRRDRPHKRQEQDNAEITLQQSLASQES